MGAGDSATTSFLIWGRGDTYRERMFKGVAVGMRRPPKNSKDIPSVRCCAGCLGHRGDRDHPLLMEPTVRHGARHSVGSAAIRRMPRVLGDSRAGGCRKLKSQGS